MEPRRHTYIFVGFTDEEKGEAESHFYVRQMTTEQVAATDAMVSLHTLGLAPTEIWATHSDKHLNAALAYLAKQLNLPVTGVNVEQAGSTDSEEFATRQDSEHHDSCADAGDLECAHLAHLERQALRHKV